jgi:hypothetical protein
MKTKKTLNRRELIGLTVAGSAAFSTQSCTPLNNQNTQEFQVTAQQALRIRKNVEKLEKPEKDLLKKVVRTLKDNGMWFTLAEIHKNRCSGVHKTEFFLPWHRAYLNYFEQIARQLPDCSSFTIPYWDWTASSRIPLIFGDDPDKPWDNDLDSIKPPDSWILPSVDRKCSNPPLWKRCPKPNADTGKQHENITTDSIYAIIGWDGTDRYYGHLESGSHANIHTIIEGNMILPETAALDPIFWLHHANIDRLWSKWMENNLRKTPSPNCPIEGCENCKNPPIIVEWLKSPINVESDSSSLKVYDLIDSRKLGYIYQYTSEIIVWDDCPQISKFLPGYSVKSDFDKPKTINVNDFLTVGIPASFTTPEKLNNLQQIEKSISEFLQNRLTSASDSPVPSLLLTIEVEKPENPAISIMVFINGSSDPSELTIDSPSYVTTFSFFESINGNHHHDHERKEKIERSHFIFDITNTVINLKNFDLTKATISIGPKLLRDEPSNNTEKLNLLGFGFSLAQ